MHLQEKVATVQPPLAAQFIPGFSGCTFNNCMFQFASLPAISQATDAAVPYNDLTGIDLAELWPIADHSVTIFRNTCIVCLPAALMYSLLATYRKWHGKNGCSLA